MSGYTNEAPFDGSLMVYFRERIGQDVVNEINSYMVIGLTKETEDYQKKSSLV
jgi:hypothetical protein